MPGAAQSRWSLFQILNPRPEAPPGFVGELAVPVGVPALGNFAWRPVTQSQLDRYSAAVSASSDEGGFGSFFTGSDVAFVQRFGSILGAGAGGADFGTSDELIGDAGSDVLAEETTVPDYFDESWFSDASNLSDAAADPYGGLSAWPDDVSAPPIEDFGTVDLPPLDDLSAFDINALPATGAGMPSGLGTITGNIGRGVSGIFRRGTAATGGAMAGMGARIMIQGRAIAVNKLWPVVKRYGPEFVAAGIGVSLAQLAQVMMSSPERRRRRRGISSRDVRTTKRVVRFVRSLSHDLSAIAPRPRRSSRFGSGRVELIQQK